MKQHSAKGPTGLSVGDVRRDGMVSCCAVGEKRGSSEPRRTWKTTVRVRNRAGYVCASFVAVWRRSCLGSSSLKMPTLPTARGEHEPRYVGPAEPLRLGRRRIKDSNSEGPRCTPRGVDSSGENTGIRATSHNARVPTPPKIPRPGRTSLSEHKGKIGWRTEVYARWGSNRVSWTMLGSGNPS